MAAAQRVRGCTTAQARTRLAQAVAMIEVAELVLTDPSEEAHPSVAAALAVLSGIASADAACCAALKERSRGESHTEVFDLVSTVHPDGPALAKDLRRLLTAKDDSHYGLSLVSRDKARGLVRAAKRLHEAAARVVARYP